MAQGKQLVRALFLVLVALCALPACSQQKDPRLNQPVQPLPGVSSGESSSKTSPNAAGDQADTMKPDTRPLSGAERFSLGSLGGGRNLTFMNVNFREVADSNSTSTGTGADWASASILNGQIGVRHIGARSELTATYAGGGAIYNTRDNLNETFHQVSLTERIQWRRWTLLLNDQASYLPESSFGFAGLGRDTLNGTFGNLNPSFDPSQSILTGRARRISNAFVGEVQYAISPRSSFTASGSYGILHVLDDGFVDNHNVGFRAAYDYALNSSDAVGINYSFIRFTFNGQNNALQNHVAQLAYGRRITGRLALQLYGGPSFVMFGDSGTISSSGTRISWSAGALLRYQKKRTGASLSYLHGVSGGAGLFGGAERDEIQGSVDRKLTRQLHGSANFGYARNSALGQVLLLVFVVPSNFHFNSWYGGASLNRRLGRQVSLVSDYSLQRQTANSSVCFSASCGTTFLRHQFGLGLRWSLHPE